MTTHQAVDRQGYERQTRLVAIARRVMRQPHRDSCWAPWLRCTCPDPAEALAVILGDEVVAPLERAQARLRGDLEALVERWTIKADDYGADSKLGMAFTQCANELAALVARQR